MEVESSEVKNDEPVVEEEAPQTELSSELQIIPSLDASSNGDEAATLAELWPSRKPKSDSFTPARTVKKKKSSLTMRKRQSSLATSLKLALRSGKARSYEKYLSSDHTAYALDVIRSAAMVRAEEVQSSLDPNIPSFIKILVRSHVGGCFFMGLPGAYCRAYLPLEDATLIVEDEHGKEYDVKYLGHKTGLSAGWRQFSIDHNLLEGDVLVIQIIEASRLKVHIIKACNISEVDNAMEPCGLDSPAEIPETCECALFLLVCKFLARYNIVICSTLCYLFCLFKGAAQDDPIPRNLDTRKRLKSIPPSMLQKKKKKSCKENSLTPETGRSAEHSGNHSDEVGSEVLESSKLSVPKLHFKDVATFENFKILIDGAPLDSEFLEDIRLKYYDLCCSQNEFLHENLMEGINLKLIVGAISEIVSISDAVRACNLSTNRDLLLSWDRTLNAFDLLGMNVGFLRARLKRLISLAFDLDSEVEARKLAEARSKRAFVEDEIRKLEMKLSELEEANEKLEIEIGSLRPKVETYELKFCEQVNAPW
ncbi:hypothetical protein SAY86_014062 [Trapa natans]|uniref:TF-B3 domain-containing protein n=1 Tax=Trapa natans TaxID=22666 RepID=A0AAN7KS17_TRANT|nr:hypothetical protein SAY86_014062 [Trapa natans]